MKPARHQPAVPLTDLPQAGSLEDVDPPVAFPLRWQMRDEFRFLRGLGTWRRKASIVDRAELLRGYLQGLALRKRWTGLECEALECEARFLLGELDGGRAA